MLKLVSAALVLLWACCVFFRSVPAGQPLGKGHMPPHQLQRAWNGARCAGSGKVVAVRLQVLVA